MMVLKSTIKPGKERYVNIITIVRHDANNYKTYTEEFYSTKMHKRLFDREYIDNVLVKTRTSFAEFNKAFEEFPEMFIGFINKNIIKSLSDDNLEVILYSKYDVKRRFNINIEDFKNEPEN